VANVHDVDGRTPATVVEGRRRILMAITDLLENSDTLRDPTSRQVLLEELDLALDTPAPRLQTVALRPQLVALAGACVDHPGGLRSLAECLELQEPQSGRVPALLRLADEWQTIQRFWAHDLQRLRQDLSPVPVTIELRRTATNWLGEAVPEYCATAWDLFSHLAVVQSPGRSRPPWLRLLDRQAPAAHSYMKELIEAFTLEWVPIEPADNGEEQTAVAGTTSTAYLVIQFEKYGADESTYIMSHWYQWASPVWHPVRGDDRHVHKDDLEAAVDEVVLATERRWADQAGPVTIEFVLPWQLLTEPVDTWCKELSGPQPSPLSLEYPVVIRSLERIRADQWHRSWRGRWKTLTAGDTDGDPIVCATEEQHAMQLEAKLRGDGSAVVLVLSGPPEPESVGERQLLTGVRAGIPAIVWHRTAEPPTRLCQFMRSTFTQGTTGRQGVAQLPQHVAKLRQAAWSEDPSTQNRHMGHGFVILWDDPERQPGRTGPAGIDTGRVRA
jgi:hypothetical protein